MIELKPCPFCGSKVHFRKYAGFIRVEAMVICPTCFVQTTRYPSGDMDDAVWLAASAWNRRIGEKDE